MAKGGAGGQPGGLSGNDGNATTGGSGGDTPFGLGGIPGINGLGPGAGGGGANNAGANAFGGSGADGGIAFAWGWPNEPAVPATWTTQSPPHNNLSGYVEGVVTAGGGGGGGGCCVVATALTNNGSWASQDKADLIQWCESTLHDKTFGETFRRGYQVIGSKIIIPHLFKTGKGIASKYVAWSFTNATNMLRGKLFNPVSIPNSAIWLFAMIITGMLVSKRYATKSWVTLYKKKQQQDFNR